MASRRFFKIFMWTVVTLFDGIVALTAGVIIWMRWGYYDERNEIKNELNRIEGVTVVNIWGHEDHQ
jgi:hypothetical protein